MLEGFQHPSGAIVERSNHLGRKPRGKLSEKTDPAAIERAGDALRDKIMDLQRGALFR